jgi:ATP-dependent exoDNAse (exonuclease V) beta subunit
MSISQDDFLPSIYRSKQEFLASLPRWRRLLANLNWHPTIDKKVERYAIEQRLLQLEKENEQIENETEQLRNENERLAELNAKIAALWPSSNSSSTPAPPTANDSPT